MHQCNSAVMFSSRPTVSYSRAAVRGVGARGGAAMGVFGYAGPAVTDNLPAIQSSPPSGYMNCVDSVDANNPANASTALWDRLPQHTPTRILERASARHWLAHCRYGWVAR